MNNTLVIYEGKYGVTKQVAHNIGAIIGNTKVLSIEEAPVEVMRFKNVVIVFCFRGPDTLRQTKPYLKKMQHQLEDKKIAAVGVGLASIDLKNYMSSINEMIEVKKGWTHFVAGELKIEQLSKEDQEIIKRFMKRVKMPYKDMGKLNLETVAEIGESLRNQFRVVEKPVPKEQLKKEIETFVKKHNMLALATGSHNEVRCSPVEYIYDQACFYIITEGGLKFRGLTQNTSVSFGIYDSYKGMDQLSGLQVTASAQLVAASSPEYIRIMGLRGVKKEMLQSLAIDLHMVKLVPSEYEFLYSPFAKAGYDSRQHIEHV